MYSLSLLPLFIFTLSIGTHADGTQSQTSVPGYGALTTGSVTGTIETTSTYQVTSQCVISNPTMTPACNAGSQITISGSSSTDCQPNGCELASASGSTAVAAPSTSETPSLPCTTVSQGATSVSPEQQSAFSYLSSILSSISATSNLTTVLPSPSVRTSCVTTISDISSSLATPVTAATSLSFSVSLTSSTSGCGGSRSTQIPSSPVTPASISTARSSVVVANTFVTSSNSCPSQTITPSTLATSASGGCSASGLETTIDPTTTGPAEATFTGDGVRLVQDLWVQLGFVAGIAILL